MESSDASQQCSNGQDSANKIVQRSRSFSINVVLPPLSHALAASRRNSDRAAVQLNIPRAFRRSRSLDYTDSSSSRRSDAVESRSNSKRRRQVCQVDGCNKCPRRGGYCFHHGGGRVCSHEGCNKSVQTGGKCYAHGGGSRCSVSHCNRAAKKEGWCQAHWRMKCRQEAV